MNRFFLLLLLSLTPLMAQPSDKALHEPTTIGPYLQLDPTTGDILVRWFTYPAQPSVMEYQGSKGPSALGSPEVSTTHEVRLPTQPSGSNFSYRVKLLDKWSPLYEVKTGPLTGPQVNFLILGDMQDAGVLQPPRRWKEVAYGALLKAQEYKASFLLLPGDLTEDDYPGYWQAFFQNGQELLARYPSLAVPGNHDSPQGQKRGRDYTNFLMYFPGPLYYGFKAGPGSFLMLNTEVTAQQDFQDDLEQLKFADNFLKTAQTSPWVLALFHIPPYHGLIRHQETNEKTRGFTKVFDGQVDWVITGHVHNYQRTVAVTYPGVPAPLGYGRKPGQGTGYMVIPPAGNWPEPYSKMDASSENGQLVAYPLRKDALDFQKTLSEIGFLTVEMSEKELTFSVWGMGDLSLQREVPLHLVERFTTKK